MNGMLNTIRASEHNRELLRAAQLDRAQRRPDLQPAKRRLRFDWMASLWAWWSRTARAGSRAIELPAPPSAAVQAVALPTNKSVGVPAHPLATLAAQSGPPDLPVDPIEGPPTRRFAPSADRVPEPVPAERVTTFDG